MKKVVADTPMYPVLQSEKPATGCRYFTKRPIAAPDPRRPPRSPETSESQCRFRQIPGVARDFPAADRVARSPGRGLVTWRSVCVTDSAVTRHQTRHVILPVKTDPTPRRPLQIRAPQCRPLQIQCPTSRYRSSHPPKSRREIL